MTFALAILVLLVSLQAAGARDIKGEYEKTSPALHAWFDSLASGKGLCCSFADGRTLATDDWGTHDDHYWVVIDGVRYAVPPEAVVTVPNKFGEAVVWPYTGEGGQVQIRCFLPGAGS